MKEVTRSLEMEMARETLLQTNGNRHQAADLLGVSVQTLNRRLEPQADSEK